MSTPAVMSVMVSTLVAAFSAVLNRNLSCAGAADERVVAGPALQVVVAAEALEHVDAGIADDGLRLAVAGEVDPVMPLLLVVVSASISLPASS